MGVTGTELRRNTLQKLNVDGLDKQRRGNTVLLMCHIDPQQSTCCQHASAQYHQDELQLLYLTQK